MPKELPEHLLLHYHEIALKGENREWFERALMKNATRALAPFPHTIKRMSGRILVHPENLSDIPHMIARLQKVFGIAYILHAYESVQEFETLGTNLLALVREKTFSTFRITSHRANKNLPFTSGDADRFLGAHLVQNGIPAKVKLERPDLECTVQFVEKYAFISFGKISGPGGLPVGVSGNVASLISSGIDSPVASWQMMKRGATVVFIHFHSYPYTDASSQDNVRDLVTHLASWQGPTKLYLVPFNDIQKNILTKAPQEFRVILYRRAMVRIAEALAKREGAQALVTGESLGQVASQTLENISTVDAATSMPIFRPLIGTDKKEIIAFAHAIGTYDMSTRPYKDCCSLFAADHPATRTTAERMTKIETGLDQTLLEEAVEKSECVHIMGTAIS